MAQRPRAELHAILKSLSSVAEVYYVPPSNTALVYPCIIYQRDSSYVARASNSAHFAMRRYSITVVDRLADSTIPDAVEALPYTRFDRHYRASGLHHYVFQTFF